MMAILGVFAVVVGLLLAPASASQVPVDKLIYGKVIVCASQAEAEAVLITHKTQGIEAAREVFSKSCTVAEVFFIIDGVVGRFRIGDTEMKVARIQVVMQDESLKTFYTITDENIQGET